MHWGIILESAMFFKGVVRNFCCEFSGVVLFYKEICFLLKKWRIGSK